MPIRKARLEKFACWWIMQPRTPINYQIAFRQLCNTGSAHLIELHHQRRPRHEHATHHHQLDACPRGYDASQAKLKLLEFRPRELPPTFPNGDSYWPPILLA